LRRNLQGFGSFLDAQTFDLAQHEDDPKGFRQISYGLLDKLGQLASRGIGFR